jgi:MinD-like ATPase involved in chromosome partitioning or flagellar assembly
MQDQADELRQLVLRSAAAARHPAAPPPPLIVLHGAKGGVGTTSLAVNLAVSLARAGRRAVLVDADFHQPDATALCGLSDGDSVADVLAGRRTVHEVLQPGPAGIQVVPGLWAPSALADCRS